MSVFANSQFRFDKFWLIIIILLLPYVSCKATIEPKVIEKYTDGTPSGTSEMEKNKIWIKDKKGFALL